jgi:hypothetical protein
MGCFQSAATSGPAQHHTSSDVLISAIGQPWKDIIFEPPQNALTMIWNSSQRELDLHLTQATASKLSKQAWADNCPEREEILSLKILPKP